MSRIVSLMICSCVVAVGACTARGKAAPDTTAQQAGEVAASAPAPATQSLAALAGAWRGITKAQDHDTIVGSWTFQASGDTGTVTFAEGTKVHVHDIRVAGDSILETMGPYTSTTADSRGQRVTGDVAVQVHGDSASGTVVTRLVARPESVTARVRIAGARVKP